MGGGTLIPLPCPCPQLTNKIVFVVSFVGNRGTFIRGYKAMVMDMEFLYHVGYILTSVLGLFVHELFYSILVSLLGEGTGRGVGVIGGLPSSFWKSLWETSGSRAALGSSGTCGPTGPGPMALSLPGSSLTSSTVRRHCSTSSRA